MFNLRLSGCIILLALIYFLPGRIHAQFRWGAQAGVNFANLSHDDPGVVAENTYIGFIGGLRFEAQLTKALSFYLSPQYVQKGSDAEFEREINFERTIVKNQNRYSYVEIPVGLRLRLPESGVKPYIFGGLTVAPLTSAHVEGQWIQEGILTYQFEHDVSDALTGVDVLFHIGAGIEMPLSQTTSVLLDLRYSRSLQSIDDLNQTDVYTSDVMMVVGVLFR